MKEKNDFFLYSRKLKIGGGTLKLALAGFIMAFIFAFPVSSFALEMFTPPPIQN